MLEERYSAQVFTPSDNGTEFTDQSLQVCCEAYITPGSPWENVLVESC